LLHLPGAAADYTHYVASAIGAVLVVAVGLVLKRRSEARQLRATSSK
jgi:hypothetical protein